MLLSRQVAPSSLYSGGHDAGAGRRGVLALMHSALPAACSAQYLTSNSRRLWIAPGLRSSTSIILLARTFGSGDSARDSANSRSRSEEHTSELQSRFGIS